MFHGFPLWSASDRATARCGVQTMTIEVQPVRTTAPPKTRRERRTHRGRWQSAAARPARESFRPGLRPARSRRSAPGPTPRHQGKRGSGGETRQATCNRPLFVHSRLHSYTACLTLSRSRPDRGFTAETPSTLVGGRAGAPPPLARVGRTESGEISRKKEKFPMTYLSKCGKLGVDVSSL